MKLYWTKLILVFVENFDIESRVKQKNEKTFDSRECPYFVAKKSANENRINYLSLSVGFLEKN